MRPNKMRCDVDTPESSLLAMVCNEKHQKILHHTHTHTHTHMLDTWVES